MEKGEIHEDQQLIEEFVMGKSIKEISIIHERTRGAIRRRLLHLNLIEKSQKQWKDLIEGLEDFRK